MREVTTRFLRHYGREVSKYQNVLSGTFQPSSYTVSAHIPLGAAVGATPDGRHAGEQLADGGLSPMLGRDVSGPTASLMSVSKLDNWRDANGSLLNVKFSPSTLAGEGGLKKLMAYLRAFCRLGIQHIQCINPTDDEIGHMAQGAVEARGGDHCGFFRELRVSDVVSILEMAR